MTPWRLYAADMPLGDPIPYPKSLDTARVHREWRPLNHDPALMASGIQRQCQFPAAELQRNLQGNPSTFLPFQNGQSVAMHGFRHASTSQSGTDSVASSPKPQYAPNLVRIPLCGEISSFQPLGAHISNTFQVPVSGFAQVYQQPLALYQQAVPLRPPMQTYASVARSSTSTSRGRPRSRSFSQSILCSQLPDLTLEQPRPIFIQIPRLEQRHSASNLHSQYSHALQHPQSYQSSPISPHYQQAQYPQHLQNAYHSQNVQHQQALLYSQAAQNAQRVHLYQNNAHPSQSLQQMRAPRRKQSSESCQSANRGSCNQASGYQYPRSLHHDQKTQKICNDPNLNTHLAQRQQKPQNSSSQNDKSGRSSERHDLQKYASSLEVRGASIGRNILYADVARGGQTSHHPRKSQSTSQARPSSRGSETARNDQNILFAELSRHAQSSDKPQKAQDDPPATHKPISRPPSPAITAALELQRIVLIAQEKYKKSRQHVSRASTGSVSCFPKCLPMLVTFLKEPFTPHHLRKAH